ncbi:MAG: sulfotransferase [Phycisphaerales bacterium]|nr:sulfotransferase [Phycisphaerales bacterium]MCB9856514.1 sulfotransferase [Phycisphaerales bacterium]MCB9863995.1 sulfotransferase [Phycisphaerales bacterium]
MIELTYIAAPSYSGSTLLTFLLNSHPDIATVGELKWGTIDTGTYRCSCGDRLIDCAFWLSIKARVEQKGLPFDFERPPTDFRLHNKSIGDRLMRARNRGTTFEAMRKTALSILPKCRKRMETARNVNKAAMEAILFLQKGRILLDASKDPVRLMHLINTGDYNVRVLHLLRDGRGVMNSTIKKKGLDAETAAHDWAHTHRQIERLAARLHDGTYRQVRYEDLCRNAPIECESIFAFLGLDPGKAALSMEDVPHHILGNAMRLGSINAIKLDESWRNELDDRSGRIFESVAGVQNRRYGYV